VMLGAREKEKFRKILTEGVGSGVGCGLEKQYIVKCEYRMLWFTLYDELVISKMSQCSQSERTQQNIGAAREKKKL